MTPVKHACKRAYRAPSLFSGARRHGMLAPEAEDSARALSAVHHDEALLTVQIVRAATAMSDARASGDEPDLLRSAVALGNLLTTARREREAIEILTGVDELARAGPPEALGWWLLYLGTAEQYLDDRLSAQQRFDEALQLARTHGLTTLESYVLHHMGRCYVEAGDVELGRRSFQQALTLREALGDPRQASTCRALDALDEAAFGQSPPD